jgi:tetratricopeptide (TPR) repeat protein
MRVVPLVCAVLVWSLGLQGCERGGARYQEAVGAFYTAVAALQVGESGLAEERFRRVTELYPEEPAAWANLGLVLLVRGEADSAAARLDRARTQAPDVSGIQLLSALASREAGDTVAAAEYLRRATELDPRNVRALLLLAQTMEREGRAAEAIGVLDRILAVRPGSNVALLERARLAAEARDANELATSLDRLTAQGSLDAVGAGAEFASLRAAAAAGDFTRVAAEVGRLEVRLQQQPAYLEDQNALAIGPDRSELLLLRFLSLPNPPARPAPADMAVSFTAESLSTGAEPQQAWVRALWLADGAPVALMGVDRSTLWIRVGANPEETYPFPRTASDTPLAPAAVVAVDYNYDFLMDLVLAGPGGLRLLRAEETTFRDVTAEALPAAAVRDVYAAGWAADLDMDGDMDLVLARVEGPPAVLRNRGDGAFETAGGFEDVARLRDFVWVDVDAEGTADAVLLDAAGRVHVYLNRRFREPQFEPQPLPAMPAAISAVGAADINGDAVVDLVVLDAGGTATRLSLRDGEWETGALARWPQSPAGAAGMTRLFLSDLDNNGAVDLVASGPGAAQVWLSTERGLETLRSLAVQVTDVADVSDDGRLDLIGVSADGTPLSFVNQGTRDYFWVSMSPRAARADGDRRANSFGIGGEIEIRAGLLYQKQPIQGPTTHFGLGEQPEAQVARIVWPHGGVQAEFNLSATSELMLARQRLHGSCPWVFAYDGKTMQFVTDFIWRTALGLRINAQGTAGVIHSEDWIRIRGDQLVPRDGFYDVRITADLWETHFFDHVALMLVDHPADTEVFVDERFTLPAPPLALRALSPPRPVAGAWDHRGRDVTALIRERDERYLDTFELGPYQGVAEKHFVEVLLGDDVPDGVPLWLVASGWVYPTDSSINLAISQGDHARPHGLRLEVPDGSGGWAVAATDLGFPAGKSKTILIDLKNVFRPGTPRRLRLGTNMEIYWDRIAWAAGRPDVGLRTTRLLPAGAELRHRGFSAVHQASRRAPELPDYGTLASTAPLWRDLEGYHTRFGDVLPLVDSIDGRYVIMNAGDELAFRFTEVAPPPGGWTRSFVLIGDGWVKDGNYNTGFSRTVLPLPYRGMTEYDRPPGRLEDDPAYRLHPDDWKNFHTRYVTPRSFHDALVPRVGRER